MNAPQLMLKKPLDKRAYRLRCRFKVEPYPEHARLERERVKIAVRFVGDMKKQGWEYVERFGFTMKGPFPYVSPVTIHVDRTPPAREMLRGVAQGARYLSNGGTMASVMPKLPLTEWWEYELAGVFARETILAERPDPHEERG